MKRRRYTPTLAVLSIGLITGCAREKSDLSLGDEAVRLHPTSAWAYDRRGRAHGVRGELDDAISDFSQAIRLEPNNAMTYGLRGKAYSEKGEFGKAVVDLSEGIRLNPNDSLAYNNRGWTYFRMGEFHKAMSDFNEAIRLNPKDGEAHNGLAWLLATCPEAPLRNGKKAVETAKKACELVGWKAWYCVGTLGAAYAEAGDFEQAVRFQKQAMNMPGYAEKDRADARNRLGLYEHQKPYHGSAK